MLKKTLKNCLTLLLAAAMLLPAPAFARDEMQNTDPDKYFIEVDTGNQVVTVYQKDDDGEYTRIVRRFVCTTGKTEGTEEDPASPTPSGTWKMGARERFGKFANFAGEYSRYWTQIVGGIYFHSIMFGDRDVNELKKSPFRNLGKNASHGCIRLYVEDAKWLYYNACFGTTVNVRRIWTLMNIWNSRPIYTMKSPLRTKPHGYPWKRLSFAPATAPTTS